MKIVNIILSLVLLISLPISVICLTYNLALRLPDLYQYEFKASGVLEDMNLEMNEDELGMFFSDFMMKKTEEFQIEYKFGENTDPLFTGEEQEAMEKFRWNADILLVIGGISFIFAFAAYLLLYKQNLKMLIRRTFTKAAVAYLVLAGILAALMLINPMTTLQHDMIFNYEVKEFQALPKLITSSLLFRFEAATLFVSFVAMILLWYFTWKITKPRRIFGNLR